MEITFKFEIGDIVVFKAAMAQTRALGVTIPTFRMVNERVSVECPGGVQLQYKLGGVDGLALEQELVSEMDFSPDDWAAIIGGLRPQRPS